MPTLTQVKLPPPKTFSEFEDIVVSALQTRSPRTAPKRWGRSGQGQNGVDIYYEDELARSTGVQCKLVSSFTIDDMKRAIAAAESFTPGLENFLIALGLPRDAKLQKAALEIAARRATKNKFRVGLLFWDDIADDLARDPVELSKHYPQFFPPWFAQSSVVGSSLPDEIAKRRYEAMRELGAFRMSCLPKKSHPDMEWSDACDEIALYLDNHAEYLRTFRQRFAGVLPREVDDCVATAEAKAVDGAFDLSKLPDEPFIPRSASRAANAMYEQIENAEERLKKFLEKHPRLKF